MVAMSGAIMPAPLAMPQIETLLLPIRAVAVAPLGNVSVVMIALAASCQRPGAADATRVSLTPSKEDALSCSPMPTFNALHTSSATHTPPFPPHSPLHIP